MTKENKSETELEVKYAVVSIQPFEEKLRLLHAQLVQPRVYEVNLRFDTAMGDLTHTHQVLRLRQDTQARLTYKGMGELQGGVQKRTEIEVTVSDYLSTRHLLEALGYQVSMMYEKYRAVYDFEGVLVCLDEMPFGDFIEVEGENSQRIHQTSLKLGLRWEERILESYASLFDKIRFRMNLNFRDITFENFQGIEVDCLK